MLAPSLYEATLRSRRRPTCYLPGDVGFFTSFENDMGKQNGTLRIFRVADYEVSPHADRQTESGPVDRGVAEAEAS